LLKSGIILSASAATVKCREVLLLHPDALDN
jgi:hypothetical protein